MQKVVVIVGPTASGKSALGVELARRFNGEVISADSRQVYKGLDIGTGKITKREMKGVPHHLLDIASPKKTVSAGDFTRLARKAIIDIGKRGKLPIVVGGTGFYIDALTGRISLPAVAPNAKLRAQLSKRTAAQLFSILKRADPKRARMMDTPSERNNKVRLIRAIEIAKSGSKAHDTKPEYDILWIGVQPKGTVLRAKITKRLKDRIKAGMITEAIVLHKKGLSFKRMKELGLEYRSLARFLLGEISQADMRKELESDIWRYARKQIGYWKRNKDIEWFDPKAASKVIRAVTRWL